MSNHTYQVIIAGAGPAGLAAALTLSAYKISFCIIDANISAVPKLGDALPPNVKPLLQQLGILDLLNHPKHIPYYGNKIIWGTNNIHEKHFINNVHSHGFLTNRLYFEHQLRQVIQNQSISFYNGYQLKKVLNEEDLVEVQIQKDSEHITLTAQYIIDATGRKASVCRHLGIHKKQIDHQFTISFWHQLQQPIPRQIWVEATENGWWYISPTSTGLVNCMFFTLKGLIPQKNEITPFLKTELDKTHYIHKIIQPNKEELLNHKIMPSGTSYLKQPYGKNWLAIGDAAFSYDPISSYGITSALATGFYGAHAIASKIANEEEAFLTYHYILENGNRAYFQKLGHQYNIEKRWKNSYYWKNRFAQP